MRKNLSFMALSTYLRIGSQLVVFILLARILGADQFGLVAYWTAVTILVVLPVNYGFGLQLMREINLRKENVNIIVENTLSAKVFLSFLVIVLSVFASFYSIDESAIYLLLLLSAHSDSYSEYFNCILRSSGEFQVEARIAFINSIIQFIVIVAIALITKSAFYVSAGYFFSRSIGMFFTWRGVLGVFPEFKSIWQKLTNRNIKKTLIAGFPYAADMGVSTVNTVLDTVLLKQHVSIQAIGEYQAGARLMLGGATMATVINNVYLPKLSEYSQQSDAYVKSLKQLNFIMICCGGLVSIVFLFFNDIITHKIFGSGYETLTVLLPWFGLLLFTRYIAASFGVNLTALGYQNIRVFANIAFLVFFVIAVFLIVPSSGGVGMIVSCFLSTVLLILVYLICLLYKKIPIGIDYRSLIVIFAVLYSFFYYFRI